MSNTSLNKVVNQFPLQDEFEGNSVIGDEVFPVSVFWLVLVLKSMAIQNSTAISCRTCRSRRMGSPSLSSQGLTSLV